MNIHMQSLDSHFSDKISDTTKIQVPLVRRSSSQRTASMLWVHCFHHYSIMPTS